MLLFLSKPIGAAGSAVDIQDSCQQLADSKHLINS
jgi:hypothetical protein